MSKTKKNPVNSKENKQDTHQDIVEDIDTPNGAPDTPFVDVDDSDDGLGDGLSDGLSDGSSIGARLRQLRENKGLSREDVFNELNIPVSSLRAFEKEDFAQLPADIFVRGQIGLYGSYLDLDGKETAKLFFQAREQQLSRSSSRGYAAPHRSLAAKKLAEPAHVSSATVAAILLVVIVIFITTFCFYTGWSPFAYFLDKEDPAVSLLNSDTIEPETTELYGNSGIVPEIKPDETIATTEVEAGQQSEDNAKNNAQDNADDNIKDNDSRQDQEAPPVTQQSGD